MTERAPLYADEALGQVAEMSTAALDTIPRALQASGTLYDDSQSVPHTPRFGLTATNVQEAIEEVAARFAGGRRQSYYPYTHRREHDRIGRVHRVGKWVAGSYDGSEVTHTHGTYGHRYPFGAFSAYNARGAPHRDHDRLSTLNGPDLVTNASTLSSDAHTAGFAKFVRTSGDWTADGYQVGKWVYSLGWADGPSNGRFEVSAVSALELTVKDPADKIATEAAAANHEVRGTTSGQSGHNGFRSGLWIPAGSLDVEERIHFRAAGVLESSANSDTFVEMLLEPNPPLDLPGTDQFAGANRMRMLTGALGATWTGAKRVVWDCEFYLGFAATGDEYHYDWTLEVQDVLSVGGKVQVTGGFNFKEQDAQLVPLFRVDRLANLDTYDATYQVPAERRLEFQKLDIEVVH